MSAPNSDFINAYKFDNSIITDSYKIKDNKGNIVNLDGIINPLVVDNRHLVSPMDNQRSTNACAAYSAATIVESLYWKRTGKLKQLNSHQIYAKAKEIDGNPNQYGTRLEMAFDAIFNLCKNDPEFSFLNNAKKYVSGNDGTINTINIYKFLLHKDDFLQAGFLLDDGWCNCTNTNYIIKKGTKKLGGHAVVLAGYVPEGFIICNSWGTNWGAKGFGILPYDLFLEQLQYTAGISFT